MRLRPVAARPLMPEVNGEKTAQPMAVTRREGGDLGLPFPRQDGGTSPEAPRRCQSPVAGIVSAACWLSGTSGAAFEVLRCEPRLHPSNTCTGCERTRLFSSGRLNMKGGASESA